MRYEWKRLWIRPHDTVFWDREGYVADPRGRADNLVNPALREFAQIADNRCLVLLGEPGIGKSHTVQEEVALLEPQVTAAGDALLVVDLRSIGSEQRLMEKVFHSREFEGWLAGSHRLHLFLDSLDECLLRVGTVAALLADELPQYPLERLLLRIACRTAVWPDAMLGTALRDMYGQDACALYELAPLRREDVVRAATAHNVDGEAFAQAVARLGAAPFASRPITLDLLLRSYASDGQLPTSRCALYERGCRMLADETNPSRRAGRDVRRLTVAQRFAVATRIAAEMAFGNRYAVSTGSERDDVPPEALRLSDLSGGTEEAFGERVDVDEEALRETLDTGLFSSRGGNLLGWAHQTYMEFLAAWYLHDHRVLADRLLAILTHSDGRTIPQLQETAAWLALMDPQLLASLASTEPEVVLLSDVASTEPRVREELVSQLLVRFEDGRLSVREIPPRDHLRKLCHQGLEGQLRPVIGEQTQSITCRWVAVDIAEACELRPLQDVLLQVALDGAEPYQVRVQCAAALWRIADEATKAQMRPLLASTPEEDKDDELRGFALFALWPGYLSTAELLAVLPLPNNRELMGQYFAFLHSRIAEGLKPDDLPIALDWAAEQEHPTASLHPFGKAVAAIVREAWQHLERDDIRERLARASWVWMQEYETALPGVSGDGEPRLADDSAGPLKRRSFIAAVMDEVVQNGGDPGPVAMARPHLFVEGDLVWLLDQVAGAASPAHEKAYAKLVRYLLGWPSLGDFELIYAACQTSTALRSQYDHILEPVVLGSERAAEMKRHDDLMRQIEDRRAARSEASPASRQEQVAAHLEGFDAGNLDAWVLLNRDLCLGAEDHLAYPEHEFDLTSLPGWQEADEIVRERIIGAAEQYLRRATPDITRWVGTDTIYRPAFAGYRALQLLAEKRPETLDDLPAEVWERWAPMCLAFPVGNVDPNWERFRALAVVAYKHAPQAVIDTLLRLIDKENAEGKWLFALDIVDRCWDVRLADALAEKVSDPALTPGSLGTLLSCLLPHREDGMLPASQRAAAVASQIVRNYAECGEEHDRAREAAHTLMASAQGAGWSVVWPVVVQDHAFGRKLFEAVAYREHGAAALSALTEEQLADLYLWLAGEYPPSEDPLVPGAHFVEPRESVAQWRDNVVMHLRSRGTERACAAMARLAEALPDLPWLRLLLRQTQALTRRTTWRPFSPGVIVRLAQDASSRLVQHADHLMDLVLESLGRFEQALHGETPLVRFLWYPAGKDANQRGVVRPREENDLSDLIRRHLREDLTDWPVVANREVQIRPRRGDKPGEETDIHVDAVVLDANGSPLDTVTVIVETKGCWNPDLDKAMETQLVGRYLKDNECQHGVYVIGWYGSHVWDGRDRRKRAVPALTLAEARARYTAQAESLSVGNIRVAAVVLDAALR